MENYFLSIYFCLQHMTEAHSIFDFKGLFQWFKQVDFSLKLMGVGMLLLLPLLKWMPLFVVFIFLSWVGERLIKKQKLSVSKFNPTQYGMILLFVFYLLGMIWTENVTTGWKNVEYKLSFLLLPIFFIFFNHKINNRRWLQIFIFGLVINCLLLLFFAAFRSLNSDAADDVSKFWKESDFSFYMHRSYLSAYMSIGALMMIGLFLKTKEITLLILFFLFTLIIVLSASKAGLIVLFSGSFGLILRFVIGHFSSNRVRWFSFFFVLALSSTVLLSDIVRVRFKSAWNALFTAEVMNNKSKDSTEARVMMWSASWELIQSNFWTGLGTGDVDDELQRVNMARNNRGVVEQKLNSHNAFLTMFLQLGIFGFLFFCFGLLYLFRYFWKRKSVFGVIVLFVFVINFFFESFLETRAGVFPFCWLVLSILSFEVCGPKNHKHEDSMV